MVDEQRALPRIERDVRPRMDGGLGDDAAPRIGHVGERDDRRAQDRRREGKAQLEVGRSRDVLAERRLDRDTLGPRIGRPAGWLSIVRRDERDQRNATRTALFGGDRVAPEMHHVVETEHAPLRVVGVEVQRGDRRVREARESLRRALAAPPERPRDEPGDHAAMREDERTPVRPDARTQRLDRGIGARPETLERFATTERDVPTPRRERLELRRETRRDLGARQALPRAHVGLAPRRIERRFRVRRAPRARRALKIGGEHHVDGPAARTPGA